jgi:hypothetical protein
VTDSAAPSLLMRLVRTAFAKFARAEPILVAAPLMETLLLGLTGQARYGRSPEELATIVAGALAEGPVLLCPTWERYYGRRPDDGSAFEVTLSAVQPAGPSSVLAAVLPISILRAPEDQRFREKMDRSWSPLLVIHAMDIVPDMSWAQDAAVVFWAPRSPALKLFHVPRNRTEQVIERDFKALLARSQGTGDFGYVVPPEVNPEGRLAIELPRVGAGGDSVPLEDLFEMVECGVHLLEDRHLIQDKQAEGYTRILGERDIRRDGTIAGADEFVRWAKVPAENRLRAGDIVFRTFVNPMDRGKPAVAELTADDLPLTADRTGITTLRPARPLTAPQRKMAVLFLRSTLMRDFAVINGLHVLSPETLRGMLVPQPDAALAATLEGLDTARVRLEQWRDESESLLNSVFEDDNLGDARRRILDSGRQLRMRVEAAGLLDDFAHQVRTRYPHPIAYRWSEVQVQLSKDEKAGAYQAILETAEILLGYCALVVLALAHEAGLHVSTLDELRKRLSPGKYGPTMGDWWNLVANNKAFKRLPGGDPLTEFQAAFTNREVIEACQRIKNRRNDEAHTRRVDVHDLPSAIAETYADLTTLLRHTSFLADLPLVQISDVSWDAIRQTAQVGYQELMGDNALVPGRKRTHPSSDLEVGSLYLSTEDGRLHLLRPFLLRRRCPVCRSWETFHIDKAPQGSPMEIKSLERGHAAKDPHLRTVFEQVNFLSQPGR